MAQAPASTKAANSSSSRSMRSEEQLSAQRDPTELVRAYLAERGQKATAENVRNVLQQNARQQAEGGPGLIPELKNDLASASESSAPRGAGGTTAPRQNPPAANLGSNPYGDEGPAVNPGAPRPQPGQMGAGPGGVEGGMGSGFDGLTPGLIAAGLAIAKAVLGDGGQTNMGNQPMPPTGRMMDVNPTGIPAPPAQAALPNAASAPTQLEGPMLKALDEPATMLPPPAQTGRMSSTITNPFDVMQGQQLPAGINPNSVPSQPQGAMTKTLPQNMPQNAPNIPLRPGRTAPPDMSIIDLILRNLPRLAR